MVQCSRKTEEADNPDKPQEGKENENRGENDALLIKATKKVVIKPEDVAPLWVCSDNHQSLLTGIAVLRLVSHLQSTRYALHCCSDFPTCSSVPEALLFHPSQALDDPAE